MRPVPRWMLATVVLGTIGIGGCLFPSDRSNELTIELESFPPLFLKDTVALAARVVDAAGEVVPNTVIDFSSDDGTVVSVLDETSLLAVGVGSTMVRATAVGFEGTAPAAVPVRVRGLIEVDSVLPTAVRFGDTMSVFGVGLNPDSLFNVTLGGVEATIASFEPADPDQPNRLGRLLVWVPPPAERRSALTVLGFNGGVLFPDTIDVAQRDIYEPNDTIPWRLGNVPFGIRNPGVAFETRGRADRVVAADWYTFTNATARDRTIIVFSEAVGSETFQVFMTDSLFWNSPVQDFGIGSRSWTIGPETYLCDGKPVTFGGEVVTFGELVFPFTLLALADLPPGEFHVIVPYTAPAEPEPYELLIAPSYFSVVARDVAEENDYCDVAAPLSVTVGQTLSVDNPHDIDWYRFTVTGATQTFTATVTAAQPEADLDLYVVRDDRPTALPLMTLGTEVGTSEGVTVDLAPASYFLVVVDFAGLPTEYGLTSALGAPPAPGPGVAPAPARVGALGDALTRLAEKRAAARAELTDGRRALLLDRVKRLMEELSSTRR